MRRLLLGLILALGLIGCAKKEAAGPDPNAVYTLKHREKQVGDVNEIVDIGHLGMAGDFGASEMEDDLADQVAYTEWVQELPFEGTVPTKARRAYTIARRQPDSHGQGLPRVFQNRTVLIERNPKGRYSFRLDGGRDLTKKEATWLRNEFEDYKTVPISKVLPSTPVKIDEPWLIDPELAVWNELVRNTTLNKYKASDTTGKLTRVYEQDGRPRGTIEVTYKLQMKAKTSFALSGWVAVTQTIDFVIDGSSSDYNSHLRWQIDAVSSRTIDGTRLRIKGVYTGEYTLKTVGTGEKVENTPGLELPDPPIETNPDSKKRERKWD